MAPFMRTFRHLFARSSYSKDKKLEEKQSKTGTVIAFHNCGQAVWTPRDYSSLAREGFAHNAIVYRCIKMIAEAASSVAILAIENKEVLDSHPLLELLNHPNQLQCGPDLLESWFSYLLISGNAYLEQVTVGTEVRELHVLRPDRVKVVSGREGWPEAYEYTANGQCLRFQQNADQAVRPILHMSLFHPTNDHYGMSPIEAAANAIDIHNEASAWNKALLDNSARPSGALVYSAKDGNLTSDQFERLKTELDDHYQGAKNAGRPLLLDGGLDWKSMGLSPRDMDFIESKNIAAREIALAIGVPPMLLGIPGDNTYSNYQEANRSFWRQTILPLVSRTLKVVAGWLGPNYGEKIELRADLEQVEALSSERESLWNRIHASDFLTLNEKRAAVGYGPIEGGDSFSQSENSAFK